MSSLERDGQTVEEALAAALEELGLSRHQVEVEVLSEEGPATVRVSPVRALDLAREDAVDFLEGLLDSMDLEGTVEVAVEEDGLMATMLGPDLGILIGRHGRTLEAVQELLRAAVQHQADGRVRVLLDIEGYRDRRREALHDLTREMAERALQEGEVRLEPMPAFERKVIHDAIAEIDGVQSASEGEDPRRYVVIRSE